MSVKQIKDIRYAHVWVYTPPTISWWQSWKKWFQLKNVAWYQIYFANYDLPQIYKNLNKVNCQFLIGRRSSGWLLSPYSSSRPRNHPSCSTDRDSGEMKQMDFGISCTSAQVQCTSAIWSLFMKIPFIFRSEDLYSGLLNPRRLNSTWISGEEKK